MKTTHCNLIFLTLVLSLPTAHATITLTASDTFSAPSGTTPGNLAITGDLSIFKGLDVGTTPVGALPASAINIDWYDTALLPKTASFDLTDANATFQWRDNLAGGSAVRNKMTLNAANVLSLYNATGAAANISLNGSTGAINLTGVGSGIFANGTPIFTLDSAGKVNFSNSGTSQNTNTTPSISPTTGALTLAGGLGVMGSINTAADSYFNGVRVGKGGGNISTNTAQGAGALYLNTTGERDTAMGYSSLYQNGSGSDNTAVGALALGGSVSGSGNSAVGTGAGYLSKSSLLKDVVDSVFLGRFSKGANGLNNNTNSIVIGAYAIGEGSNTTVIGNSATTKTRLFGETVSSSLKVSGGTDTNSLSVSGSSHLGAIAENLSYLPAGVTGSYYGPVKTGSNFYQHDFLITKTGDETTGDFGFPLGSFTTGGSDITVDVTTLGSSQDSGSAHFVLSGKSRAIDSDPLVVSEYHAFGGAADFELLGYCFGGATSLGIRFNAKNSTPGQITERTVQVKVSGLGFGGFPQDRNPTVMGQPPIAKVDSTNRPNGGTTTKTITAAEIKLDGKVTISQPQGDISMGIYQ